MDLSETVTIQSIITIALACITIANFFSSRGRLSSEDIKHQTENQVKTNMKLDQLCTQSNDLQLTIRELKNNNESISRELAVISSKTDTYFDRVDDHEERIIQLEKTQSKIWKKIDEHETQIEVNKKD